MIDFEKFSDIIVAEIQDSYPEVSETFIRDEVDNMIVFGKMNPRELADAYRQFCVKCGQCCEKCPSYMGGICKKYSQRDDVCVLYPCYDPDPTCVLALKIVKYEILSKIR
jgi:hypothetical protein